MSDEIQGEAPPPAAPAEDRDPPPEVAAYHDWTVAIAVAHVKAQQEIGDAS